MHRQEASFFSRVGVVWFAPEPSNKAMQTDGHFTVTADRRRFVRPKE